MEKLIENSLTKTCTRCKIEKNLNCFNKNNKRKDKLDYNCKICINKANKKYYWKNKNFLSIKKQIYYVNNRKIKQNSSKLFYQQHKDARRKYINNKYKTNIKFAIECKLRSRIVKALKIQRGKKYIKSMELIGCTIQELKEHLEKQFQPGMGWDNRKDWHIDHIKPVSSFNLLDIEEQKKCFHYSNLQPLWAKDNLEKHNKILDKKKIKKS